MFKSQLMGFAAAALLALPALASAQSQQEKLGSPGPSGTEQQSEQTGQTGKNQPPTGQYGTSGKQAMPKSEQAFMVDAAMGNLAEVKMGQLAEQQAQNESVKELGRTLATDHQKANDNLQQVFTNQQIAFPQTVSDKHAKTFTKLSEAKPDQFDKKFVDAIVKDHQEDLKKYKAWQKKAKQQEVKDYLEQTLPHLEEHLKTAQEIQKQLKSSPKAS